MDPSTVSTAPKGSPKPTTNDITHCEQVHDDIAYDFKDAHDQERAIQGEAHFHRLGWKRLAVVLVVDSIALGSLGLPSAFANLGMVAGLILNVGIALIAVYTSYIIGKVQLKFPTVAHYTDIGRLMFGKYGSVVFSTIFACQFILTTGSHCLTGSVAFSTIASSGTCTVVFGVVSAILLFFLAIPPSFAEIAIMGYVDFASIIIAIGITIIATGIQSHAGNSTVSGAPWSAWPKENLSLSEAFVSLNNIVFAYAYGGAQPSFMYEMHTPGDYMKSIWVLTILEVIIYSLTGALIYAFVGQDVQSPALLSAGSTLSRVAFGIALPVIFISGSINTTVVCRFIHGRIYRDSITRYVNTKTGWITWLALVSGVTLFAWIIAEAIPFFSQLLSVQSSLFVSGLSFYFPPMMWFLLLKEGHWYDRKNLRAACLNGIIFAIGLIILGCGTYSSVLSVVCASIWSLPNFHR